MKSLDEVDGEFSDQVSAAKNKLRFAVIHWGARLHYAVPAVLHSARMLQALYTDACAPALQRSVFRCWPAALRPAAFRRFTARQLPQNLPLSLVQAYVYPTLQQHVFDRVAGRWRKSAALTHRLKVGGHALGRKAIEQGFRGANALYVHPCVSTDAVTEAKRRGLFVVVEAISHPFNKLVEAEEYSRYRERLPHSETEIHKNIALFKDEAIQADLVLAASPFVYHGLVELGISSGSIRVVPYGIEETFFDRGAKPHVGRALYVGNVGYLKGVQYLAEAARLLLQRGFSGEVRVVGPNDRRLVRKPEFAGPTYIGPVARNEVKKEFLHADVFVFPTLSDGFGIVLLEAMAAGLPVIATANCGAVVRDGENGFIVRTRDGREIADRIEQIATDRDLRGRLSSCALGTAARFSLHQYEESLVKAITSRAPN